MTIGATPVDSSSPTTIPLPTVISPDNTGQTSGGNVTPVPIQGHPGSYIDSSNNPTTAVMMGYLYSRIVQKGNAVTGSGGKTLNFSFTNNNNQGNSIVVCMAMGEVEGANIALAVTDNAGGGGNTYTKAISASQSTTLESAIFYATNIKAGSNTVTVTISGSSSTNTAIAVEVYEVWGTIQLAGTLDQTAIGNNAGSTSPATGALQPTVPNELCFAAIAAGGGTITAGTGFNLDSGSLSPTGGNLVSFGAESQSLVGFGSITPSATLSGSNAWAMCAATFRSIIVPIEGTIKEHTVPNATLSSVASSASSVSLFASNLAARGRIIYNDSTQILYVAFAATATTSTYTIQIPPGGYYEFSKPIYTGAVSGIWVSANGNARLTETY